ncbi:MAG: hypothetical protein BWY30_00231 [Tenericutes bacterium ADurb.Bin239]|nr:MAG: hypothetical protein BWY30_00231 [Tenericutes bacterium ADurb.Bin239]
MKKKKTMVRLWGDHIVISSLFIGLAISLAFVALTFVTIEILAKYIVVIAEKKKDFIYGFGTLAILIAFVINNLWIKPQRNIVKSSDLKESGREG